MKKVLLVVLAVLISVAFVTTVFAQATKPGTETKPAEKGPSPKDTGAPSVAKEGPAAAAGAAKAKTWQGEFVSMDPATKTMVVKDKKGEKTVNYSEVKKMGDFKAGDKITLQYYEKEGKIWAANIKKVGAKAPPKGKQEAVSAGVPEPKAAPAPAPAPAK